MKKQVFAVAAFFSLCLWLGFSSSAADQSMPEDLVSKLQGAFNSWNEEAYASLFAAELRQQESLFFRELKSVFGVEHASFFQPQLLDSGEDGPRLFLQAVFDNAYSAQVQTWDLRIRPAGGDGFITEKKIRNDLGLLYKLAIPSDRFEAASRVEIRHEDIHFVFSEAFVFYDNIPGLETGLLVIGEGLVSYSPSLPREKHQLELAYKTRTLNKKIDYLFCRVSNSYFQESVQISPAGPGQVTVPPEGVMVRAAGLFQKHYPKFFTVVNSLSGERYSFLPQGLEAVFEFQTAEKKEFAYIYTPFGEEEIHFLEQSRQMLINLYSPADESGQKKMFISFQEKFDVLHYDLEVSVSPKTHQFSAKARLAVKSRLNVLDSVKLRLNKDLEIVRIQDHLGRELFYSRDMLRDLLYVYFLEPFGREAPISLDIYYRGRLVPPEPTTDVLSAGQINDTFILTPPKFDSFLYSRSASWYPEPTDEDFFTARQKIIVPPEYLCVANGLLVERSTLSGPTSVEGLDKAGHAVYVFESRQPVKYLSFIVGTFNEEAKDAGPPPLRYLISSNVFSLKRMDISLLGDILDYYQGLFGPYPYENLTVVHRLWPVGGGHSPASFVVLNEPPRSVDSRLPLNPASPVDLSRWREYFIAHEIAHQWCGQSLTWLTYHDQWLSEGLAQFAAVQFLGEKHGERAWMSILERFCQWTNSTSRWGEISLGSRLSYLNFEAYQAILYNKSTLVLHLLREVIGSETFFAGLRDFFETHRYSAARTSDFRRAMEKASGRDLSRFFKGWFDSHLLPDTRLKLGEVGEASDRRLEVKVRQMSETFVFPLWLEWQEGGRRVVHKLIVDGPEASFLLPFKGRLKAVKVNPQKIVPGSLKVEY